MRKYGRFMAASALAVCMGMSASGAHNELTLQTNKAGGEGAADDVRAVF